MDKSSVLIMLSLFTLLTGMGFAAYEIWATDKAKRTGEHVDGSKPRPNA